MVVLLIMLLISPFSYAQQERSFELKTSSLADSVQILALLAKGNELNETAPDKALFYFTEALQKSKVINYKKGVVLAITRISFWHFGNDIDATVKEARQGMLVYEQEQMANIEMKAELHLVLAEAYDEKGIRDSSAFYYYLLNREIENKAITNPDLTIRIYTKLAIFWINFNYDIGPNAENVQTLKSFVEKAKVAAGQMKDSADAKSSVYFLQGAFFHGIKQFDSARAYYFTYLAEREKLKKLSLPRKISTLTNISDTYLQQSRPVEALKYIEEVARIGKIPEQNKFLVFYIAFNELQRAKALYQLKQYTASIELIEKTIEKLKTTGEHLREEVVEAYKISSDSYEAIGRFEKALQYKNTYLTLYDSLNKKEKLDIIHGLEIRYRISEKDKELAEQQLTIAAIQNKVRTRNIWIISISALILFSMTIFTMWRRKNIHRQKLQQEKINNFNNEMVIARLNATITGEERERNRIAAELHDGIGGLLAAAKMNFELIKPRASENIRPDLEDGIRLLQNASAELRNTAHNLFPEILIQNGLLEAIQHFCKSIGSDKSTAIRFQSTGTPHRYNREFELSVYRIVQELVHNIVKHAAATEALVQTSFYETGIDITIEDNGVGMPENAIENRVGIGLKSIAARAKAMNGKFDIQSNPGLGTSAHLEFVSPPDNTIAND